MDREKVHVVGVGCRGKIDVEKIRALGVKGILEITEDGETLHVHTLYGDKDVPRRDVLLLKCLCCKGKTHVAGEAFIGESEDTTEGDKFDMVRRLEGMHRGRTLCLLAKRAFQVHPLQRLPKRLPCVQLHQVRVRQSEYRRSE